MIGDERATRVLIVHDSRTVRASLRRTITSAPDLTVVGELESAHRLVETVLQLAPDVVVMDVVMPDIDGWEATRMLMARAPTAIVLVSQVVDPRDAKVALEAIRAGALAIVDPPPPPDDVALSYRRQSFLSLVRSASQARPRQGDERAVGERIAGPRRVRRPARAIGIVASVGGPAAIASVLERLPQGGFPPLFVVQHLARGFSEGLARWFASSGHPVVVGEAGALPRAGHVYVAPEDRHLGMTPDGRVAVSDAPPVGLFRPAATWLLRSLATSIGRDAAGVVLTGMGEDGAAGALELHRAGGEVVVQDEASSVVFGMPQAAIACGAASEVLPLGEIAQWIVDKRGSVR